MMTEKININGQDIWIMIESHITHMAGDEREEYFTASYHPIDPVIDSTGDTFFDNEHKPLAFCSPAEALDYAKQKLLAAY